MDRRTRARRALRSNARRAAPPPAPGSTGGRPRRLPPASSARSSPAAYEPSAPLGPSDEARQHRFAVVLAEDDRVEAESAEPRENPPESRLVRVGPPPRLAPAHPDV